MDPKQLDAIERWNCLFAVIFVIGAFLVFDAPVVLGVAVGSLLACANFYGIHKLLERSIKSEGSARILIQLLLVAKMVLLMLLVFLVLKYLPLNPAGLAVGLSIFLLSIVAESLRFVLGHRVDNGRA